MLLVRLVSSQIYDFTGNQSLSCTAIKLFWHHLHLGIEKPRKRRKSPAFDERLVQTYEAISRCVPPSTAPQRGLLIAHGIPADLRPSMAGKREMKRSLRLKDREAAKALVLDTTRQLMRC